MKRLLLAGVVLGLLAAGPVRAQPQTPVLTLRVKPTDLDAAHGKAVLDV